MDTREDRRNYFSAKEIVLRWEGGNLADFLSALVATLAATEQAKKEGE